MKQLLPPKTGSISNEEPRYKPSRAYNTMKEPAHTRTTVAKHGEAESREVHNQVGSQTHASSRAPGNKFFFHLVVPTEGH
jgi:hypothetical protein